MKKILLLTTVLILVLSNLSFGESKFPDLKGDEWYGKNVLALINKDLIKGFPDGTFKPKSNITVSQFIVVAVRTIDPTIETASGVWYAPYLNKAIKYGIVKEGEFIDLNTPITRGQMAKILVKVLEYNGETLSESSKFISQIGDYNLISSEYKPYIVKAYALGLMGGFPDGMFKPDQNATRADSSVMLHRVFDKSVRSQPVIKNEYVSSRGVPLIDGKEVTKLDGSKIEQYGNKEHLDKYLEVREMLARDFPNQMIEVLGSDVFMAIYVIDNESSNLNFADVMIAFDYNTDYTQNVVVINDLNNTNKLISEKCIKILSPQYSDEMSERLFSKERFEKTIDNRQYLISFNPKYNHYNFTILFKE